MNNTLQTNGFVGGLNMDIDIASIPDNQYRYAENVRIVTDKDGTSGVLLNIHGAQLLVGGDFITSDQTIISAVTINKYAIILTADTNKICRLYRVWEYENPPLKNILVIKGLLGYSNTSNVKIVANYESDSNIKIYMTDGDSTIKSFNVMDNRYVYEPGAVNESLDEDGNIKDPSAIDITPSAMLAPPLVTKLGVGSLTSGVVLYSYLLFNARGSSTLTSPTSNLVHLAIGSTENSLNDYNGSEKETLTNKSVLLNISLIDLNSGINYNRFYNRCRLYRIKYVDNTELPTIDVIDEINISANLSSLNYEDIGQLAINTITLEEFNAKNNSTFIPSTIEKKDNILFAAGIKLNSWDPEYDARAYRCTKAGKLVLKAGNSEFDITIPSMPDHGTDAEKEIYRNIDLDHDCINPYNIVKDDFSESVSYLYSNEKLNGKRVLGGSGLNVSYRFLVFDTTLDNTGNVGAAGGLDSAKITVYSSANKDIKFKYLEDDYDGVVADDRVFSVSYPESYRRLSNYSDPYIASKYKGYQRDEIYRFGIVFHNSKGVSSSVHWIGDIRMPHPQDYCGFYAETNLIGKALGLKFEVNNIPSDAISYDIVRCKRTIKDRTVIMLGILSSITNYPYKYLGSSGLNNELDHRPVVPLGYFEGDLWWKGLDLVFGIIDVSASALFWDKVRSEYVTLISPELDIMQNSIMEQLDGCYAEVAYYLESRASDPFIKSPKYFITTDYTYNSFTTQRVKQDQRIGMHFDLNINGYVICTNGILSGGGYSRNTVTSLISKRHYPHYTRLTPGVRITADIENNAIFPLLMILNNIEDKNPFYKAIGSINYLNMAMMQNRQSEWDGGVNRSSYFGYCAVLNGQFSKIPRITGVDVSKVRGSLYIKNTINIRPNTSFSVPVVNIKKRITPYGGNSFNSRTNSIYISTNSSTLVNNTNSSSIVYGGDTCLAVLDHRTATPWPESGMTGGSLKYAQLSCTDYIPFETSINLNLQYGETTSKSCVDSKTITNLYLASTIEGGTVGGYNKLSKPYYAYNDAYSVQGDAKKYVPKGAYDVTNMNNINRIVYSEIKTSNEISDSWLLFKAANYLDVDSQYGKVTNLKSFNDKLMFWQDKSVGVASVNDRSLITDSNESALVLGTGGILTRYDYVTTGNGSSVVNDDSIVQSDSTLYWYDLDKNELCSYSDQIHKLSKEKGVQTFLNATKGLKVHDALYDSKFNELLFCFNDKVLVYNEYTQGFTSFYTYNPDNHLSFSDKLLYIKNNGITENTDNTLYIPLSKLLFVVNKDPLVTKTFDNVYFNGKFDVLKEVLTKAKFTTKNQTATILEDYIDGGYAIDYREDTYRFAIGRELAEDPSSYPGRLKGKYLICDYTINCNGKSGFNLPYVNTTYRYSLV